jgi:hypothetical protein
VTLKLTVGRFSSEQLTHASPSVESSKVVNPYQSGEVEAKAASPGRRTIQIRRIDVIPCAKMVGSLLGICCFLLMLMAYVANHLEPTNLGPVGSMEQWSRRYAFGITPLVVVPVMYGLIGIVVGVLIAVVYNSLSRIAGGVVLEVDETWRQAAPDGSLAASDEPAPAPQNAASSSAT